MTESSTSCTIYKKVDVFSCTAGWGIKALYVSTHLKSFHWLMDMRVDLCSPLAPGALLPAAAEAAAWCSSEMLSLFRTSARAIFRSWISSSCICILCSRYVSRSATSRPLAELRSSADMRTDSMTCFALSLEKNAQKSRSSFKQLPAWNGCKQLTWHQDL